MTTERASGARRSTKATRSRRARDEGLLSTLTVSDVITDADIEWKGKKGAGSAVVVGWNPKATGAGLLLAPIVDTSQGGAEPTNWNVDDQAEVVLERVIRGIPRGNIQGLVGRLKAGQEVVLPTSELSVSLTNWGLGALQGQKIKLTVIGLDGANGLPLLSLFPRAERDLGKLLAEEEAEAFVVHIGRDDAKNRTWVHTSIHRQGGIVHDIRVPLEKVAVVSYLLTDFY